MTMMIDPVVPAGINECVPVSAVEVEPDVEINPAFAAESMNEPINSSAPIADKRDFPAGRASRCRHAIALRAGRDPRKPRFAERNPTPPPARTTTPDLPNELSWRARRHPTP